MQPESKPRIIIPREVYDKVMRWCQSASPNEVSGFGIVERLENGSFRVKDAILLDQENTSGDTELNPAAIADAEFDYLNQGGLRWWWHSHVNMDVFWSGTDMNAMRQLGGQGWILATVFNLKYEYRSAMYVKCKTDFGDMNSFVDQLPTEIITYYPQEKFDQWDAEFKAKVKAKVWKAHDYKTKYGGQTVLEYPDTGWYAGGSWRDADKDAAWEKYRDGLYPTEIREFSVVPRDFRGARVMVGNNLYEWDRDAHMYVYEGGGL